MELAYVPTNVMFFFLLCIYTKINKTNLLKRTEIKDSRTDLECMKNFHKSETRPKEVQYLKMNTCYNNFF